MKWWILIETNIVMGQWEEPCLRQGWAPNTLYVINKLVCNNCLTHILQQLKTPQSNHKVWVVQGVLWSMTWALMPQNELQLCCSSALESLLFTGQLCFQTMKNNCTQGYVCTHTYTHTHTHTHTIKGQYTFTNGGT